MHSGSGKQGDLFAASSALHEHARTAHVVVGRRSINSFTQLARASLAPATRAAGVVEAKVSDLSRAVPSPPPNLDSTTFCCCSTVSFRTACSSVVLPAALNLTLQPQAFESFPRRDPRDSSSCLCCLTRLSLPPSSSSSPPLSICLPASQPLTDRFFRTTPILTTRVSLRRNPSNIPARPV